MSLLRHAAVFVGLLAAWAWQGVAPAQACSCDGPMRSYKGDPADAAAVKAHEATWHLETARQILAHPRMRVYAGVVTKVELIPSMGAPFQDSVDTRAQLRVREVWRGTAARELTIYGSSNRKSSCGFSVGVGNSGYVFVEEDDRGNVTFANYCAYRILNQALGAHPPLPGQAGRVRDVFGVAEPLAKFAE
jgi:hypothetical protein